MDSLRQLCCRFAALFRRRKLEAEMAEEMRQHLERRTREKIADGMAPDEACYAARREFGGIAQVQEQCRDERRFVWFEQAGQDLCYAAKALRKTPSFTVTAVFTLAFGIGVNASLFTIYNAVALHSLPVKNPDELVTFTGRGGGAATFSHPDYLDYHERNHVFADLAAWCEGRVTFAEETAARPDVFNGVVKAAFVTDNYFPLLGARLQLGRGFVPEENRTPNTHPVLVASHGFWEQRLQRDPDVIGKTITLNGERYTVIGVTVPEFVGQPPIPPAIWIPLMMQPAGLNDRAVAKLRLIGRLKSGVSMLQAKADVDVMAGRLAELHPREGRRRTTVRLERGMRFLNVPISAPVVAVLSPLLLGFAMVLVIACTNVANLLLARGITRQQEIGVRLTLGASRGRMIRQLLTENLLLGALGGTLGLILAMWTLQLSRAFLISSFPAELQPTLRQITQLIDLSPDLRVIGFTVLVALVAAVAAGLVPALHAARTDLISTLKNDGSAFGRRVSQSRLRNLLVIVQVAVCLMLLSCAGLLVRNMIKLRHIDHGFDAAGAFQVELTSTRNAGRFSAEVRQALETLRALPEVAAVCAFASTPFMHLSQVTLRAPAEAATEVDSGRAISSCTVSAGFFETFDIALQRGRAFTAGDADAGARVLVISEALARQLWPSGDALGKTIALRNGVGSAKDATGGADARAWHDYEVIGVARNVRAEALETNETLVYRPLADTAALSGIALRLRQDSTAALARLTQQAEAAGVTLRFCDRMSTFLDIKTKPFAALAWLSGTLGALALLMASVGLYGVMAFSVSQRVREIGIRVALGATAERVVRLFLRQGLRLVAIGMAFGLAGGALFALALSRTMFGLRGAFDPIAFGAVTLLLGVVALFACWLPARRATKVDPMVALRYE